MKRTGTLPAAIAIAVLGLCASAGAQPVYRVIGADGKLTFSDKPPTAQSAGKVSGSAGSTSPGTGDAGLPFELKQVMSRFPVTLYTSPDCAPCGDARALLSARGIPFSERTVKTAEDAAALQRISGESSLPLLVVGGQRLTGFSQADWTQTLDAAGYPPNSVLPAGYKNGKATPLAPAKKPIPTPAPSAPDNNPPPVEPNAGPSPSNPAGIQF